MSHIDTLKVYEEYKAAGFDDKTARNLTNILENSFVEKTKEWIQELKQDFASQKLVAILAGLMLIALLSLIGLTWSLTVDVQVLKSCGILKQ